MTNKWVHVDNKWTVFFCLFLLKFGAEVKIAGNVWDESNAFATDMAKDKGDCFNLLIYPKLIAK